ncbi:TEA/ATTS domain family-domain-containing protein [Lanmaoa asiatica]|nr:TEA/ATTS domain family-domain-containing protein [Lanmaoa asiatica]
MESPEVDIKPAILTDDLPSNKSLLTIPGAGKLKQSRYEDVWPEDVHAAFMEAVALYPPMGKRRLKYYRVSMHENEHFSDANRAKSFGRCQLIQSYILEKTGKNRSRKQVSSHLQRLKKIHKDNPAMRPLFSERSQPPSEHCSAPQLETVAISSQDIFTNISFSTRHLKSDFDLTVNLQNADTGADSSSTFSYASELNGGSCNALDLSTNSHNQPPFFSLRRFFPHNNSRRVSSILPTATTSPSSKTRYCSKMRYMEGFKAAQRSTYPGPRYQCVALLQSFLYKADKWTRV